MVPAPFVVVVDANALFPLTLRDTLLRAAAAGYYQLRWSEVILDEMERNLVSTDTMSAEKAVRLREHMQRFFPDAMVTDFERLVDAMPNDP
ncbi:MAG: PIN domain-containing protein, partial [Deltaproteobacteria bacterium]